MKKKKNQDSYVVPASVRMWARFSGLCLVAAVGMVYCTFAESYGFDDAVAYLVMAALFVLAFLAAESCPRRQISKA